MKARKNINTNEWEFLGTPEEIKELIGCEKPKSTRKKHSAATKRKMSRSAKKRAR